MRCLIFMLLLMPLLALADAVNIGDSEAQVVQALGPPESIMDAGSRKILFYETSKITLKSGVVIKLEKRVPSNPTPKTTSEPAAKTPISGKHALAPPLSQSVAPLTVEPSSTRSLYLGDGYTIELEVPKNFATTRNASGARHFPMQYQSKGFEDRFTLTVVSLRDEGMENLSVFQVVDGVIESSEQAYWDFSEKYSQMRIVDGERAAFFCYEGIPKGGEPLLMRFQSIAVRVKGGFIFVTVTGPSAEFRSIQPQMDAMLLSLKIEDSKS